MEEKILLRDILNISDEEMSNWKIRLIHNHEDDNVLDLFLNKPNVVNNDWLFWNYKKAAEFKEGQIAIALVRMDKNSDFYLLTTIKKITKDFNIRKRVNRVGKFETWI